MKTLPNSPWSMNIPNGKARLEVIAASQLSSEFTRPDLPILITQIEGRKDLECLMDWLSSQGRRSNVLRFARLPATAPFPVYRRDVPRSSLTSGSQSSTGLSRVEVGDGGGDGVAFDVTGGFVIGQHQLA